MSARDAIMAAVRAGQPPATPVPEIPTFRRPVGDPLERFIDASTAVGAQVVTARGEVPAAVDALMAERHPDLDTVAATVPGLAAATLRLDAVDDPHELAALDLLVCEGAFGVAENGAVWLSESAMGHRAAPFLAQHVVLVLHRQRIVPDMHAAYARLEIEADGFGLFVAGPSKTADIEQSLVIGAHGPRSLTILVMEGSET